MTEPDCAPPLELRRIKTTYIYCARGVRVHPAFDLLISEFGYNPNRLVPLSEGYEALLHFGLKHGVEQMRKHGGSADTIGSAGSYTGSSPASGVSGASSCTSSLPTDSASFRDPTWLSAKLDVAFPGGRTQDAHEYVSRDTLGHGAFALVVLLEHRTSGNLLVSKQVLVTGLSRREENQLATEVAVQAKLRHRYVLPLLGFYEEPGRLCLCLPYAAGGTLAKYLDDLASRGDGMLLDGSQMNGETIDVETARTWLCQIARGLRYVHSCHVLHRDLSAQNIFLTYDGDAQIGDFGLSHKLAGHSMASRSAREHSFRSDGEHGGSAGDGSFRRRNLPPPTHFAQSQCGTPTYMSPELIRGDPYGAASDVWALGVILFEMLTLRTPFSAPSLGGLVNAISVHRYCKRGLDALRTSEAPPELKRLVYVEGGEAGLLHSDPEQRMSLNELLERFPLETDEVAGTRGSTEGEEGASPPI